MLEAGRVKRRYWTQALRVKSMNYCRISCLWPTTSPTVPRFEGTINGLTALHQTLILIDRLSVALLPWRGWESERSDGEVCGGGLRDHGGCRR